jgi:hypothetical protein|tara:strand:- start:199 stop:696 length:498 start_codon:yes stop_codon:yes gene_type:complete
VNTSITRSNPSQGQSVLYDEWFKTTVRKESKRSKLPPSKYAEFLSILNHSGGFLATAADEFGIHPRSVVNVMNKEPMFKYAVQQIQGHHDSERLEDLERVSFRNALVDKNFSERAFQLKALAPDRYRERGGVQQTQVNVMVAGTPIKERAKVIAEREKELKGSDG